MNSSETIIPMMGLFIPIGICVILPIVIVALITRWRTHVDNNRAGVIAKALECSPSIDINKLSEILSGNQKQYGTDQTLIRRLLIGLIFSFLGIVATISTIVFAIMGLDYEIELSAGIISGICYAVGVAYLIIYRVMRKGSDTESRD